MPDNHQLQELQWWNCKVTGKIVEMPALYNGRKMKLLNFDHTLIETLKGFQASLHTSDVRISNAIALPSLVSG